MRRLTDSPLRLALVLAAAFVGIVLALEWFAPTPGGPAGSSDATAPAGAAAYADLLARDGREVVRLREPVAEAGEIGTLVVLEPQHVDPEEARAIGRRVRDGMRLVAGGGATGWLRDVLAEPPAKGDGAPGRARVVGEAPETAGLRAVRFVRGGAWARLGDTASLLATASGPVAVAAGQGEGRVVLLADPTPLLNGALADADNAAFALDVAARRPGSPSWSPSTATRTRGLRALPGRVQSGRCSAWPSPPSCSSGAWRAGSGRRRTRRGRSRRHGATTPRRSPPRWRRAATRTGCGPRRRGSEWRPATPASIPTLA